MSKHTPGPWTVESVHSECLHDICLGYKHPNGGNPEVIASVNYDKEGDGPVVIPRTEATANARLMAAAPELYAACVMYMAGAPISCVVADMRKAIAKAEGKS